MRIILSLLCLLLLATVGLCQTYDCRGDLMEVSPPAGTRAPGDLLGTLSTSISGPDGLAHDGTNLLVMSSSLYVVDESSGATLGTIPTSSTSDFGVGYDVIRKLYVTANPSDDVVSTYDGVSPVPINQWSYPGTGFCGLAHDRTRDVYWVCDWSADTLSAIDAVTGAIGTVYDLTIYGCTRMAGVGYDPTYDEIVVGSRDANMSFVLDAGSGSLIVSFMAATPGSNDPHGCCCTPRSTMWHSSQPGGTLYEQDTGHGSVPPPPSVDVTCNGDDAGVLITFGANARLDFNFVAGAAAGTSCDVWLVLMSPFGPFSYDGAGPISGWWPGLSNAYFTGPYADAIGTCLDRPVPIGNYVFHGGVDTVPNGFITLGAVLVHDKVDFTVF